VKAKLSTDGGARGNPGPAGYGAVVRDAATGAVLAERADGLGVTTNNVAEYSGLIAGLRAAAELGAAEVDVRLDSKLVIEQMSGRWQVRQPHLQPLASEAAGLVRRFDRVRFSWIPRARNTHADRLANEAMDAQAARPPSACPPSRTHETTSRAHVTGAAERPAVAKLDGHDTDPTSTATHHKQAGAASRASGSLAAAAQTAPPAHWIGATGTPTTFLLLRHAQTELSAARRYSGRGDIPLTGVGERQAEAAAHRLGQQQPPVADGVATVVSSPLKRCIRTAELVAAALSTQLVVHDGLTEVDFGEWEGLTFAEAAASHPDLHSRWLADGSLAAPGGESLDAVHRRVRRARDELIATYGGSALVVVSHVTPIKALLRMALDTGPSLLRRLHLDLASLSIAEFYPDGAALVRLVNDTSHLS
jgi:broad specificity phosphatase PhoE/ribonuclease HI